MSQQVHIQKEFYMILVFELEYRSNSEVYERLFFEAISSHELEGTISRNNFLLKLYVEADTKEQLESFVNDFTAHLPHSIFLYANDARIVDEMPDVKYKSEVTDILQLPFCPKCLSKALDRNSSDYYNIFTSCNACGYGKDGENKSYEEEIKEIAMFVKHGDTVDISTFYGQHVIGQLSPICDSISFDVIAYDMATIEKYTYVEKHELVALASFEKPLIRLKTKPQLSIDYATLNTELIRFKLPDDMLLQLLMEELHKLGIDIVFITSTEIPANKQRLLLESEKTKEPIEVVASEEHLVITRGKKGLPEFPVNIEQVNPSLGMFYSVIKEHSLGHENIAGVILSRKHDSIIFSYGAKYGTVEYLHMKFGLESMADTFEQIVATDENGKKIISNFKNKFPEHYEKISKIVFKNHVSNIYDLWGVVSIVLGLSNGNNLSRAAKTLEQNSLLFLGDKGPRIDYKLISQDGKVYLDPLMTIRTAISFKLAGVDPLTLSYGVIESFLEFLANELDEMQQSMDVSAIAMAGSLFDNKRIFAKVSKEIGKNHKLYFNNQLPVEGLNMFYGGVSLA